MKTYLGFVCVTFLFLAVFLVGLFSFLTNYEPNRCNMTFMYEYPQLVKIHLRKDISSMYNKYALYAYGEGRNIHYVRDKKFTGIPVLFIPGNRGSPMQVRSLASVSLTKAMRSKTPFIFDYFAVDLNEDLSGLYGGFLNEQTTFVNICIKKILSLYRRDLAYRAITPKSVILIAHSMGGMMAKGLYLEPDFNPDEVGLIITLASPHSPALLTDSLLTAYYRRVNTFWDQSQSAVVRMESAAENVTLLSIGGGPRDLLVRSDLILTPHADISVTTPRIPSVWLSVDHLCILWCKELVLAIVRLLFDMVDHSSRQLTTNIQLRKNISFYHLLDKSAGKSYHSSIFPETVELFTPQDSNPSSSGTWIELNNKTQYTWTKSKGSTNDATYFSLSLATPYDTLALSTINHETRDWIFSCISYTNYNGMKKCKIGVNLSGQARIAPTLDRKKKNAVINLSLLRKERYTHLIVRTLPTKEFVEIHFDLFKRKTRFIPGITNYLMKTTLVSKTDAKALYYSIDLLGVHKFWHNYELHVTPRDCPLSVFGVAAFRVPWSNEGSSTFLKGPTGSIVISMQTSKPDKESRNPFVEIFLNPQCQYEISIERSVLWTVGSVVGRFGVVLLSHMTVCLLLTLAYQIKALGAVSPGCPLLQVVMPAVAKPYFVVQATALAGTIAQSLTTILPFLPDTDVKEAGGIVEVVLIPLFLHLSAFALTYLSATCVLLSVALQGQAINGIFLKFINKYFFGLSWLSEYVMSGLSKMPIVMAAFMITVSSSACGALALTIGLLFYFFKMVSLYEDFWEEIVYWPLKVLKWKLTQRRSTSETGDGTSNEFPKFTLPPIKDISFHLTLLMLWSISVLISIPSLLVWAKNYKYSAHLAPDPVFYNAVIMSSCGGILWQFDVPKTRLPCSRLLGYLIVGLCVLLMIYAQTSLYRIPYILSGVFVCVSLHQLLGGFFVDAVEEEGEGGSCNPPPIQDDSEPPGILTATEENIDDELNTHQLTVSDEAEDAAGIATPGKETENMTEKESPSEEGSSTSSFEHLSEHEQL